MSRRKYVPSKKCPVEKVSVNNMSVENMSVEKTSRCPINVTQISVIQCSSCGTVDRVVASNTRGPGLNYSLRQFSKQSLLFGVNH